MRRRRRFVVHSRPFGARPDAGHCPFSGTGLYPRTAMTSSFHSLAALVALTLAVPTAGAAAQEVVQPLPGTTDADRLADDMRRLAANPRDVDALIAAGELSLKLDDLSAAAALFARAEKVDPRNARMKAGMASILVRSERPGEALRYFAQAESYGLTVAQFAADRGLAYDLIGEQERAQRDYRLALKTTPSDETTRRYALSLGISGRREQALEQLEPLLRKTDRGAWRARAFVLAMTGDVAGAEKIATTMMPGAMAQGLQPFFQRLPTLPAIDRAFAVHFGEVHARADRVADARLAPAMAPLAIEPQPVQLAAAQPVAVPAKQDRRGRRRGRDPQPVQVAAVTPAPTPTPNPAPPAYRAAPVLATVQPLPARVEPAPVVARSAPVLASVQPLPAPAFAARPLVQQPPAPTLVARAAPIDLTTPAQPTRVTTPPPVQLAAAQPTRVVPAAASVVVTPAASQPEPARPTLAQVAPLLPQTAVAAPAPVQLAAVAPTPPKRLAARASEDSILARIIAGLSIPASELDVAEPVHVTAPAPQTAAHVIAEAKAKEARDAAAEKLVAQAEVKPPVTRKGRGKPVVAAEEEAPVLTAAEKKAADRKAAADKKALAAKKAADEKKLADAKAAAEEKKAARANPGRIWVQVAGGAYAGDLPKAYAAVKAKAPAVFGSRAGWSTPLRATNRVLTGPFKTEAEARGVVNQLAKAGVSAFTFTSDAGQPVMKLPSK